MTGTAEKSVRAAEVVQRRVAKPLKPIPKVMDAR
jgi:hypothetical protein